LHRRYAAIELCPTPIGYVDLNALTESVQRDIAIAKEVKAK
jgi:hypothetical protein